MERVTTAVDIFRCGAVKRHEAQSMGMVEDNFGEDLDNTQEAVEEALDALADVKAYTLKVDELADFKAAQYALRNLSDDFPKGHDVPPLYQANVEVTGSEKDIKEN